MIAISGLEAELAMVPPAPMPEREFDRFLSDHGCYSRPKNGEYAIYRKSDHKFISGYAVAHSKGRKREILACYKRSFLKRLAEIEITDELEDQS